MSSATVAAGTDGCVTSTLGAVTINEIGAKSRRGSNGSLESSTTLVTYVLVEPMVSV